MLEYGRYGKGTTILGELQEGWGDKEKGECAGLRVSRDMSDLHEACRLGDLSLVQRFLLDPTASINSPDSKQGWTPLYRAVICAHLPVVSLLLRMGADPNIQHALGETALHHAAESGYVDIARTLLGAGADPNIQQSDGDTALHKAVLRGDFLLASLLLETRANPNLSNHTVEAR